MSDTDAWWRSSSSRLRKVAIFLSVALVVLVVWYSKFYHTALATRDVYLKAHNRILGAALAVERAQFWLSSRQSSQQEPILWALPEELRSYRRLLSKEHIEADECPSPSASPRCRSDAANSAAVQHGIYKSQHSYTDCRNESFLVFNDQSLPENTTFFEYIEIASEALFEAILNREQLLIQRLPVGPPVSSQERHRLSDEQLQSLTQTDVMVSRRRLLLQEDGTDHFLRSENADDNDVDALEDDLVFPLTTLIVRDPDLDPTRAPLLSSDTQHQPATTSSSSTPSDDNLAGDASSFSAALSSSPARNSASALPGTSSASSTPLAALTLIPNANATTEYINDTITAASRPLGTANDTITELHASSQNNSTIISANHTTNDSSPTSPDAIITTIRSTRASDTILSSTNSNTIAKTNKDNTTATQQSSSTTTSAAPTLNNNNDNDSNNKHNLGDANRSSTSTKTTTQPLTREEEREKEKAKPTPTNDPNVVVSAPTTATESNLPPLRTHNNTHISINSASSSAAPQEVPPRPSRLPDQMSTSSNSTSAPARLTAPDASHGSHNNETNSTAATSVTTTTASPALSSSSTLASTAVLSHKTTISSANHSSHNSPKPAAAGVVPRIVVEVPDVPNRHEPPFPLPDPKQIIAQVIEGTAGFDRYQLRLVPSPLWRRFRDPQRSEDREFECFFYLPSHCDGSAIIETNHSTASSTSPPTTQIRRRKEKKRQKEEKTASLRTSSPPSLAYYSALHGSVRYWNATEKFLPAVNYSTRSMAETKFEPPASLVAMLPAKSQGEKIPRSWWLGQVRRYLLRPIWKVRTYLTSVMKEIFAEDKLVLPHPMTVVLLEDPADSTSGYSTTMRSLKRMIDLLESDVHVNRSKIIIASQSSFVREFLGTVATKLVSSAERRRCEEIETCSRAADAYDHLNAGVCRARVSMHYTPLVQHRLENLAPAANSVGPEREILIRMAEMYLAASADTLLCAYASSARCRLAYSLSLAQPHPKGAARFVDLNE